MNPIRVAILTISDRSSRGEREDVSGPTIQKAAHHQGWVAETLAVVPDEIKAIRSILTQWADSSVFDLILTTGGTGFAPRDVTPEATLGILDKQAPGIAETLRAHSLKITPHAMLSRAVAGIRGATLIINFPGSPKACAESFELLAPVLPHAIELLRESVAAETGHAASSPQELL